MIEKIKKIKEAENKTLAQLEAAKKEAAAIISTAEQEGRDIVKKALEDADRKAAEIINTTASEADSQAENIISDGIEKAKQIRDKVEGRIEHASAIIIKHVVGDV